MSAVSIEEVLRERLRERRARVVRAVESPTAVGAKPLKLLRACTGRRVLVKTKGGFEVAGVLEFADSQMNLVLRDCVDESGARYGRVVVPGRSVLYVSASELPRSVSLLDYATCREPLAGTDRRGPLGEVAGTE
jgi:small nuclear ribonucleoprotein (snRNP)-like protein